MQNIKLSLEYDGTRYQGFMKKNSSDTVYHKLSEGIRRITGEDTELFAALKTEPGVHAKAQTINFRLSHPYDPEKLKFQLNRLLPMDIAIRESLEVPPRFHAALNLTSCTYLCQIDTGTVPNIFSQAYAMHIPGPLDLDAMETAAAMLGGTHDFAAFSAGKHKKSTLCTLTEITLSAEPDGKSLTLLMRADKFLRKMPQLLVGTILDIGLAKRAATDIPRIFSGEMPCSAPAPSPAFCLIDTSYL